MKTLEEYKVKLTADAKTLLEDIAEELRVNKTITTNFINNLMDCLEKEVKQTTNNEYAIIARVVNIKILGIGKNEKQALESLKNEIYQFVVKIANFIEV